MNYLELEEKDGLTTIRLNGKEIKQVIDWTLKKEGLRRFAIKFDT